MGLPPALAIHEAPDRELARLGRELIKVAPGDVNGEDAARLLFNPLDVEPVPRVDGEWTEYTIKMRAAPTRT